MISVQYCACDSTVYLFPFIESSLAVNSDIFTAQSPIGIVMLVYIHGALPCFNIRYD